MPPFVLICRMDLYRPGETRSCSGEVLLERHLSTFRVCERACYVSPASTLNVAARLATLTVLGVAEPASSQVRLVRSQPVCAVSVDTYEPAATLVTVIVPLFALIEPAGLPVKSNVPVPPTITFFTIIVPSFVFVNVQLT